MDSLPKELKWKSKWYVAKRRKIYDRHNSSPDDHMSEISTFRL